MQNIRRLVVRTDAFHQHGHTFRIVRAQVKNILVGRGRVPSAGMADIGKLDDDQETRQFSFKHGLLAAMNEKASAEGLQRRVDALEVFHDRRAHVEVFEIGNGIGFHWPSPSENHATIFGISRSKPPG